MKYLAIALALASAVVAVPAEKAPRGEECTPATYACAMNPSTGCPGWEVCNTSGQWEYAGDCPPHTYCKFYQINGSPYCLPDGW